MQFKDIIGQSEIKTRLLNSVKEKRISHAQLFHGPPGSGKLSLAIALSQYLSCENPSEDDSCGECDSCRKFAKLLHPDLHFVFPVIKKDKKEPVSDNYINKWRELFSENPFFTFQEWLGKMENENKQASIHRDETKNIVKKISLKTFEAEFKTMIIWFPEKMNKEAANNLLKLLEEPPEKTVFLLISESPNDILPTIISRTTPLKIPAIKHKELAEWLSLNYEIQQSEAKKISRLSRGNISEAINHIDTNKFRQENLELLKQWIKTLLKADIKGCINFSDKLGGENRERQKSFLLYSLNIFREILIQRTKIKSISFLLKEEEEFLEIIKDKINHKKIHRIKEEFEKAHLHIQRNGNSKIIMLDLSFKLITMIRK